MDVPENPFSLNSLAALLIITSFFVLLRWVLIAGMGI
jgi:hypothetical protein